MERERFEFPSTLQDQRRYIRGEGDETLYIEIIHLL